MTPVIARAALLSLALFALDACGETSGSVLERIPDAGTGPDAPPESELQIDYFIVRSVDTCAIGEPCSRNEPDTRNGGECFEIEDGSGVRTAFRADTVQFVPPDDERVPNAQQRECFRLTIDDETSAAIDTSFEALRTRVFDLSGSEILLRLRRHDIPTMTAGFVRFENEFGIFLPAQALDVNALASRDTDFTYAITGARDPESGLAPQVEHCAGTNREIREGLAGAGYSWLTTECNETDTLLRHWMFQVTVALRDVNGFNDFYDRDYVPCGESREDPARWWPNPDECSRDPDAPTCGDDRCEGTDNDYVGHVLTDHWPRGREFVGNHCRNGRADFDETDVDVGGVCEVLGR